MEDETPTKTHISYKSHPPSARGSQAAETPSSVWSVGPNIIDYTFEFTGGLGTNARLPKVPGDFFNIAVTGEAVLPVGDLHLAPHQVVSKSAGNADTGSFESKLPDDDFLALPKSFMRCFLL